MQSVWGAGEYALLKARKQFSAIEYRGILAALRSTLSVLTFSVLWVELKNRKITRTGMQDLIKTSITFSLLSGIFVFFFFLQISQLTNDIMYITYYNIGYEYNLVINERKPFASYNALSVNLLLRSLKCACRHVLCSHLNLSKLECVVGVQCGRGFMTRPTRWRNGALIYCKHFFSSHVFFRFVPQLRPPPLLILFPSISEAIHMFFMPCRTFWTLNITMNALFQHVNVWNQFQANCSSEIRSHKYELYNSKCFVLK